MTHIVGYKIKCPKQRNSIQKETSNGFKKMILAAKTLEELSALDRRLETHYRAGTISTNQFSRLCDLVMQRSALIEISDEEN
jgi:hypothetical protein